MRNVQAAAALPADQPPNTVAAASDGNAGIWYTVFAYLAWGLLPVYWKALEALPALEILAHRVLWSFLLTAVLLFVGGSRWREVRQVLRSGRTLLTYLLISLLISANWLIYIWAVNAGFIVETSLGYFINPLVSVLLGVLVLREPMRGGQWIAIAVAAAGVSYLTIRYGSLPWIGLSLAGSFAIYGLLKKTTTVSALTGFAFETAWVFPLAAGYLLYLNSTGAGALGHTSLNTTLLLIGTGFATALPLIFFAAGAKRIPLSIVGLLQYIAPTLGFLLGIFVYNEPFNQDRLIGFSLIWLALVIYTVEGIYTRRKRLRSSGAVRQ